MGSVISVVKLVYCGRHDNQRDSRRGLGFTPSEINHEEHEINEVESRVCPSCLFVFSVVELFDSGGRRDLDRVNDNMIERFTHLTR